jgi:hypothetical protein
LIGWHGPHLPFPRSFHPFLLSLILTFLSSLSLQNYKRGEAKRKENLARMPLSASERKDVLIVTSAASALGFLACSFALLFAARRRSSSSSSPSSSSSSSSMLHVWAMKTLCDALLCLDHLWLALLALSYPNGRLAQEEERTNASSPLSSLSFSPPDSIAAPIFHAHQGEGNDSHVLPKADAMCSTQGVVLDFVVHASSIWLLLLSVELWRSSRDPFARGRAHMPLFHVFAWGFGLLACVGMIVGHVGGSQPNSPCWLDSVEKNARALRGPRLVFQLFPLTQLLAVAVSLLVLLRVALLLGRNTAQVTPYRRRVLGRGLLYVGAYGALGILKLAACLVMLGLHSDGTQPPAQQAFAYSESALLLALALVDALIAPASTSRAVLRWLPKQQQVAANRVKKTKLPQAGGGDGVDGCADDNDDDMGTTSGKLIVGRGRLHRDDDSHIIRNELALAGVSLQERGELMDGEAMEELLSLRALRRDVMLCLLFGIISTLNRRDGRQPFGDSPRRRARRQSTGSNSLQEEDGDESRSLLGGGRGPDRYVYSSGVGGGGSAYGMDHFAAAPPLLPSGLPAPRRPPQQTRQRVMLPPVYNRELDFIDFERDAFVRLRRLHGISTEDYAHSLWGDHMDQRVKQMTEHFSSSRSESFFYLTHDRRFLVKTMNSRERDVSLARCLILCLESGVTSLLWCHS